MSSIQESMANSAQLIESAQKGTISPEKFTEEITALLTSTLNARGFMATLATGAIPDKPEMRLALIEGIKNGKEFAYDLAVKNIIMSGCTAIEHEKNNRTAEAAGSRATCAGSIELVKMLADSQMTAVVKEACRAIDEYCSFNQPDQPDAASAAWIAFFQRWGYSKSALQAVAPSLRSVAEMQ